MVNILFCGNGKVFDGMLTSALSILKRTDSREPFCFYVFTMDVSHLKDTYVPIGDGEIDFLERVVRAYNPDSRVKKIDVTALTARNLTAVRMRARIAHPTRFCAF